MPVCRTIWSGIVCAVLAACSPAVEDAAEAHGGTGVGAGTAAGHHATVADAGGIVAALDIEALRTLDAARLPAGDYWHSDPAAQSRRIERILAAEHAARAALVGRFGPAVRQAAVFRDLFTPLRDRMPELGSEQQIAIHDLESRYVAARLGAGSDADFAKHRARIRSTLGEEVELQYALHASPLAIELRNAGVIFSEAEFRDTFEILDASGTDHGSFVTARKMLRERLGTQRFVRLWAQRDPRFTDLQTTALRFGLTGETLLAVWSLLLDNEDALLETAGTGNPDTAAARRSLRSIYETGRRRLTELIGDEAAEAVLRSFAAASGRLSENRR